MHGLWMALAVIGSAILFQSYSGGPAAGNARATGAPGDGPNTCVTCHNSGGSFGTVSIDLEIEDMNGNAVSTYMADSMYSMTITVNHSMGNPAGFGFQMICLEDDSDSNVPGWSNPSSNAQLSTSGGRNYVEQDGISTSNVFTVDWTAPEAGTGDLTFYLGANAVNGANGNNGDRAALSSVSISETLVDTMDTTTTNVAHLPGRPSWRVYPNPAHGQILFDGLESGSQVSIYDVQGALVRTEWFTAFKEMDVRDLEPGLYLIRSENRSEVQRLLVR